MIYNQTITHHVAQLSQYREQRILPTFTDCVTAGRILSLRTYRSILFFDLYEDGQFIQCAIRQSIAPEAFAYFNEHVSRGNIVRIEGQWGQTNTGEVTLFVNNILLISENIELIPDLHDGFNEISGRQTRELDLMLNPATMRRFRQRSQIMTSIRDYFNQREFLEVETPILQSVASGAQATPFQTHFNATNTDVYLRIAPETYLVRLLIGGMSRIYELGHTFRNEGISPRHNPEFSMIEFYETFSNMRETMTITQQVIQNCLRIVHSDITQIPYENHILDFSQFHEFTVAQSLEHYLGFENVNDRDFLLSQLEQHHIQNTMPSENIAWLQYLLFEELVEPLLIQPTFITDLPIEASPLAYSENQSTTHRFELFVVGRELANGFEQNLNYEEQLSRFNFQSQIAGRDSAMEADTQYLNAVRYGIPSLSGCGIGLDRLVMIITNSSHIRDVILYPI